MRVSSINVAQPRVTVKNLRKAQNPSFNGVGGALGTIVGSAVGLGLAAMSGGALLWTIPLIGGACGIGGDMYEKKDEPSTDEYGQPLY